MEMKVNIWSDIRCPFCYIGMRKFEKALERFPHKEKVEVVWRSFQLDTGLRTSMGLHSYDYLAKVKGMERERVVQMHDHVVNVAAEEGLDFNFEHLIVANSYNAHRLIQLAKVHGLGNEAEEKLFRSHFTEGKNIDDRETLLTIGIELGINEREVGEMLASDKYGDRVKEDERLAKSIGIRGVPFFIMNETLAVSGAQSSDVFLQALEKAWIEVEKQELPNDAAVIKK